MVLPFFAAFSHFCSGPEEAKNLAGKKALCLIQIRFTDNQASKKSHPLVKPIRCRRGYQFEL
jgi:hypothetical protein